jgi:hypothetical protein
VGILAAGLLCLAIYWFLIQARRPKGLLPLSSGEAAYVALVAANNNNHSVN